MKWDLVAVGMVGECSGYNFRVSTAPPNAFLDALAEPRRSPLFKFLAVIVLTAGGLIALLVAAESIQNNPTKSHVQFAESGMVIGQSKDTLDQRFGEGNPMEGSKSTYDLGSISGEVYTLQVTFDTSTGTAIEANLSSYYE